MSLSESGPSECASVLCHPQVLGRNLEAVVNKAMEIKDKWDDKFVSVEHLLLALVEDARFGAKLFRGEGLTKPKLEAAIKEVGGGGLLCISKPKGNEANTVMQRQWCRSDNLSRATLCLPLSLEKYCLWREASCFAAYGTDYA